MCSLPTLLLTIGTVLCSTLMIGEALPNGPPTQACESMLPAHGLPSRNLQYGLLVDRNTVNSGQPLSITVTGSAPFRGIFLQVRDLDTTRAVGSWESSVQAGTYRLVDCFGNPQTALSHASRSDKQPGATFTWQPPDCVDGASFVVRATIVRNFRETQAGLEFPVTCSNAPPAPPSTTLPPPPPPVQTTTSFVPPPPPQTPIPFVPPPPPPQATTSATPQPFVPPVVPGGTCRYSALTIIPPTYDTDFENANDYLNGWEIAGDRSWQRRSGPTQSYFTGPSSAYQGTYYAYFEASSPAQPGNEAILQTGQNLRGCFCLRFANSFNVSNRGHRFIIEIGGVEVFATNTPSAAWQSQNVQVDTSDFVRIRIIARRGQDWIGDMAIDQIRITPGSCP